MRARDDCLLFTFLTDGPDKENVPISGAVPKLQNKDHLKKGESCKGGETCLYQQHQKHNHNQQFQIFCT